MSQKFTYFDVIPKDVSLEVLKTTDPEDLDKVCQINNILYEACQDDRIIEEYLKNKNYDITKIGSIISLLNTRSLILVKYSMKHINDFVDNTYIHASIRNIFSSSSISPVYLAEMIVNYEDELDENIGEDQSLSYLFGNLVAENNRDDVIDLLDLRNLRNFGYDSHTKESDNFYKKLLNWYRLSENASAVTEKSPVSKFYSTLIYGLIIKDELSKSINLLQQYGYLPLELDISLNELKNFPNIELLKTILKYLNPNMIIMGRGMDTILIELKNTLKAEISKSRFVPKDYDNYKEMIDLIDDYLETHYST